MNQDPVAQAQRLAAGQPQRLMEQEGGVDVVSGTGRAVPGRWLAHVLGMVEERHPTLLMVATIEDAGEIGPHCGDAGPNPALFKTGLNEMRDAYRTGGVDKPLFQNEFLEGDRLTTVAGIISDTLTEGDVSAYLVWISARSIKQPGFALVYYNPDDGSVERRGRFYAVKAFSEFVGEGWHRIDADCSDPALKLCAFIGPKANDLVAVLINPTDQAHQVAVTPGSAAFQDAKTAAYRSSEGEDGEHWRELGPLPAGNVVTLIPHSVVTVKFTRP